MPPENAQHMCPQLAHVSRDAPVVWSKPALSSLEGEEPMCPRYSDDVIAEPLLRTRTQFTAKTQAKNKYRDNPLCRSLAPGDFAVSLVY